MWVSSLGHGPTVAGWRGDILQGQQSLLASTEHPAKLPEMRQGLEASGSRTLEARGTGKAGDSPAVFQTWEECRPHLD